MNDAPRRVREKITVSLHPDVLEAVDRRAEGNRSREIERALRAYYGLPPARRPFDGAGLTRRAILEATRQQRQQQRGEDS